VGFVVDRGQSGTGTGFSSSSSGFPCQYHSIVVPYSLNIIWGMDKGLVEGPVPGT
jgi:hypothetical protein